MEMRYLPSLSNSELEVAASLRGGLRYHARTPVFAGALLLIYPGG